ncbi:hypothetical protein D3C86_1798620 [compost metagenome]
MARRVGDRMRISLELADAVRDSVSNLSAPVCHAAYCLAEATLERAVDACGAREASVRVEAPEVGPLVLAIAHDCCGCFDHIADSRFDLAVARMELAGGTVHEVRECERAIITMTLQAPEGTA